MTAATHASAVGTTPSPEMAALDDLIARAPSTEPGLARLTAALHRVERSGANVVQLMELIASDLTLEADRTTSDTATEAQEAALRSAGSFVDELPPPSERASARSLGQWAAILGSALTTSSASDLLHVSTSRIRQRAAERTLYALPGHSPLRFPSFQFTADGELPGWTDVAPAIPDDTHPLAVYGFVTKPTSELVVDGERVSPRDWLATGGDPAAVIGVLSDAFTLP